MAAIGTGAKVLLAVCVILIIGIIASNVFAWKGSIVSGSITTTTTIIGLFVAAIFIAAFYYTMNPSK